VWGVALMTPLAEPAGRDIHLHINVRSLAVAKVILGVVAS